MNRKAISARKRDEIVTELEALSDKIGVSLQAIGNLAVAEYKHRLKGRAA